ncbi:DNA-binding NtrC family response regulator [Kordia periserrulae]|uniref:DNA-binding NtrC family response regulator n=1 Tax=Kordia periserrulae TaxID=701523 RepID=A0A2T6C4B7_9FLAO|nr:sigma-54 dependent transcriptional regulator [Kordia periserrulae]PTX63154.1 DNA-binding NtrC family response regulator [Kordia periserrulae]
MKLKNASILVIDDDIDVLTAMSMLLKMHAKKVITEKKPSALYSILRETPFDLIILDMNFESPVNTGNEGLYWLNEIQNINADIPVILITAYADIDLAIKSLKNGASDFIVKPWKNNHLLASIQEILDGQAKTIPTIIHKSNTLNDSEIIGESPVMESLFVKLQKIAPTDANVLILGENGTGKDLIAKTIHQNSLRKNQPYVKVDLGALTPNLFESEIFGSKKGAFTDAQQDREGRFQIANGGTLFLDEIGNVDLQQQAKLLTVLQNRFITPLGTNEQIPIDIRLICATNQKIDRLADESYFRKDLIYRINTVEIWVPPLRERGKDVLLLAKHFLKVYAEKYFKPSMKFDASFIKKLQAHSFPGNVRELQFIIERAVIMADSQVLTEQDLVFSPIEQHLASDTHQNQTVNLDEVEKNTIVRVIEKNSGNISQSAKELGVTRSALYRRMQKYGI